MWCLKGPIHRYDPVENKKYMWVLSFYEAKTHLITISDLSFSGAKTHLITMSWVSPLLVSTLTHWRTTYLAH